MDEDIDYQLQAAYEDGFTAGLEAAENDIYDAENSGYNRGWEDGYQAGVQSVEFG